MRPWVLCAVLAVFIVSNAAAQTGTICLYADPQGTQCTLSDTAPGMLSVYVIHDPLNTPYGGAGAAAFAAPKPDCMTGVTWVTDTSPLAGLMSGDSQTGVTLGYGSCITGPTHVLTIQYMVSGLSQSDCAYRVVPASGAVVIEVSPCSGWSGSLQGFGGMTYVNSSLSCECSEPAGPPVLAVSPQSFDFGSSTMYDAFWIWNDGGGVLDWSVWESASWLSAGPTAGDGYGGIAVSVVRDELPAGTYTADITVASNGGTLPVRVSMIVKESSGLFVSPESLNFDVSRVVDHLYVRNLGTGTLEWTVTWDQPWLRADPAAGVNDGYFDVIVNRSGLAGGTYTGTVTVTGGDDVIHVPVTMRVEPSQGPGGTIGVFSDPQASGCNLLDRAPGLMTAYIVHVSPAGSTASAFAAPMPACMTGATYLGETSPLPVVIGNSQTGVSAGYATCLTGAIRVLTVQYFVLGLSQTCCRFPVVPHPEFDRVEVVDCDFEAATGATAHAVINPDVSCQCSSVKTEEATWGKIKSMYSND